MRYAVVCSVAADGELAAIWISAEDRKAVSDAAKDIEKALAAAPLDHGESREGNLRIIFVAPPGARYTVEVDNSRVVIVQFWTI